MIVTYRTIAHAQQHGRLPRRPEEETMTAIATTASDTTEEVLRD
jgi:hypothetical protein